MQLKYLNLVDKVHTYLGNALKSIKYCRVYTSLFIGRYSSRFTAMPIRTLFFLFFRY